MASVSSLASGRDAGVPSKIDRDVRTSDDDGGISYAPGRAVSLVIGSLVVSRKEGEVTRAIREAPK